MVTSGVRRIRYSDFDALPDMLDSGLTAASPLRSRQFFLDALGLKLGEVGLHVGSNSPMLVHGALPPNCVWVVLPLALAGPWHMNGRLAQPQTIAVYGAGALHEGANHGDVRWAVIALGAKLACRMLELPDRSPIFQPGTHAMLACGDAAWRRAAQLVQSAAQVADADPEVFETEEARRSLRSSIIEVLQELLTSAGSSHSIPESRASLERQRLVRAIENYLRSHTTTAVSVAALEAGIGVSASRLRSALRATFGIGLQHYILLRRLTLFRMAWRSTGPNGPPLRNVALQHGFSNMLRLAKAYREIFAEELKDPSELSIVRSRRATLAPL